MLSRTWRSRARQLDPMASYLEELEAFVIDEQKIVTFKWLSHILSVPSDVAKKMLFDFVQKHSGSDAVRAMYSISGTVEKGGIKCRQFLLVPDTELEETKAKMSVSSVHVHSVAPVLPKESSVLFTVDFDLMSPLIAEDFESANPLRDNRYSSIKNADVKRTMAPKRVVAPPQAILRKPSTPSSAGSTPKIPSPATVQKKPTSALHSLFAAQTKGNSASLKRSESTSSTGSNGGTASRQTSSSAPTLSAKSKTSSTSQDSPAGAAPKKAAPTKPAKSATLSFAKADKTPEAKQEPLQKPAPEPEAEPQSPVAAPRRRAKRIVMDSDEESEGEAPAEVSRGRGRVTIAMDDEEAEEEAAPSAQSDEEVDCKSKAKEECDSDNAEANSEHEEEGSGQNEDVAAKKKKKTWGKREEEDEGDTKKNKKKRLSKDPSDDEQENGDSKKKKRRGKKDSDDEEDNEDDKKKRKGKRKSEEPPPKPLFPVVAAPTVQRTKRVKVVKTYEEDGYLVSEEVWEDVPCDPNEIMPSPVKKKPAPAPVAKPATQPKKKKDEGEDSAKKGSKDAPAPQRGIMSFFGKR